ncbi:perlucin-like [Lingula anatina]|uniref:Perlucin-like n=1 Tax=Lingula anatina TaxID=7574 RepID=A0A1S3K113_LINAN|nr:perlucin-like [Lingula anatina]|eukprot:XP_013416323.1 perlucin-like [Lingula anatina]
MAMTRSFCFALFVVVVCGIFGQGSTSTASLGNTLETMKRKLENLERGLQQVQRSINQLTRCQAPFVQLGSSCYLFSYMKKSWSDAQAYCRSMSSHLATITSWSEDKKIIIYVQNNFPDYFTWWIGGNDMASEGNWVWVENNRRVSYSNWGPREPNNEDNEDCMEIFHDKKPEWNDHLCHLAHQFICEK